MTKRIKLALLGVGGLLLLLAARRFGRPELIGPGLLLFAAGTFAAGADAIIRRYSVERNRETASRATFQGTAAILIGVVLVILSFAFAAAGASFLLGAEDRLYALLKERPGGALLALGSISGAGGGARVLGAREWGGSAGRFLGSFAERLSGVLLVLLGVILLAIGIFEVVAPAAFDSLLDGLLAPLRAAG